MMLIFILTLCGYRFTWCCLSCVWMRRLEGFSPPGVTAYRLGLLLAFNLNGLTSHQNPAALYSSLRFPMLGPANRPFFDGTFGSTAKAQFVELLYRSGAVWRCGGHSSGHWKMKLYSLGKLCVCCTLWALVSFPLPFLSLCLAPSPFSCLFLKLRKRVCEMSSHIQLM